MKLLVVGGTGFFGTHILKQAIQLGWTTSSVSLSLPKPHRKIDHVKYIVGNLLDSQVTREQLLSFSPDYIVNCAGYINHSEQPDDSKSTTEAHFHLTLELLDLLRNLQVKKFIQIGTSDEYGLSPSPQSERLTEQPFSTYSLSKTLSTHSVLARSRINGLPALVVRPFLLYGPLQDEQRFVPYVIKSCLENKSFLLGRGDVERDFLYIDDAVDAIFKLLAMVNGSGKVYNLSSGVPTKISDVVSCIQQNLGGIGNPIYSSESYRPGQNPSLYADITRLKKAIDWVPSTSLDEGIARVTAYFQDKPSNTINILG